MKDDVFTNPFATKPMEVGPDECIKLTARSLLILLHLRRIDVSYAIRQRILDERDIARLEEWHERADTAQSVADVFGEPNLQSSQTPDAVYHDLATFYNDVLYSSISEAARRALEAKGYDFTRPFAKQQMPPRRADDIVLSLLSVLRARCIDVPEATRKIILDEQDIVRLKRWLERADTARSLADVFAEPS